MTQSMTLKVLYLVVGSIFHVDLKLSLVSVTAEISSMLLFESVKFLERLIILQWNIERTFGPVLSQVLLFFETE